ncbi:hypothetical protein AB1Y20_017038 [Prymnesium parvum]|uniref:TIR domain-containing protein n=1 Tax=Prymnesium parvum TaxID=97485 RepID=A0AB34IBB0_PRYPA
MNATTSASCDETFPWIALLAIASTTVAALLLLLLLLLLLHTQSSLPSRRRPFSALVLLTSGRPPLLTLAPSKRFHLFLSHTWATGQDQTHMIKRELTALLRGIVCFLDVDDMEEVARLEEYVRSTQLVLLFLSDGYFASRNCLREVGATREEGVGLLLVQEEAAEHGGRTIDEFRAAAPEGVRQFVFEGREAVGWYRQREFRFESLHRIAEATVLACAEYASYTHVPLFHSNDEDLARCKLQCAPGQQNILMVSPNNPLAAAVADELRQMIGGLHVQPLDAPPGCEELSYDPKQDKPRFGIRPMCQSFASKAATMAPAQLRRSSIPCASPGCPFGAPAPAASQPASPSTPPPSPPAIDLRGVWVEGEEEEGEEAQQGVAEGEQGRKEEDVVVEEHQRVEMIMEEGEGEAEARRGEGREQCGGGEEARGCKDAALKARKADARAMVEGALQRRSSQRGNSLRRSSYRSQSRSSSFLGLLRLGMPDGEPSASGEERKAEVRARLKHIFERASKAVTTEASVIEALRAKKTEQTKKKLNGLLGLDLHIVKGTHYMLLLLNNLTFKGQKGDRLANDVRWALRHGCEVILVHEQRQDPELGACDFNKFFVNVPEDIALNLFQSKMAIPLRAKPFLTISAACVAQALGVQPQPLSRQQLLALYEQATAQAVRSTRRSVSFFSLTPASLAETSNESSESRADEGLPPLWALLPYGGGGILGRGSRPCVAELGARGGMRERLCTTLGQVCPSRAAPDAAAFSARSEGVQAGAANV